MRRLFRDAEPRLLVSLFLIALAGWITVAVAEAVARGSTLRLDDALLRVARQQTDVALLRGPAWFPETVRDITALGSPVVLAGCTLAIAGFLDMSGRRRMAVYLVGSVGTGVLVASALKWAFERPRPAIVPHLSQVGSSSFPSAHAMMSAVVYLTLGSLVMTVVERRRLKWYVLAVAIALTVAVGVSRVLLGVHYPSDVLAGWTLGLVWSELCWLVWHFVERRRPLETSLPDLAANRPH